MCTIEWWTDQELGTTGVTTLEVPLKPSALGLNRKVKGKVVVKLQLAYFAEHVNNSLELQKFCPDVPCDEKIVDKIKCAFAADVPREGLEDLPSVVLTPGIAFLLDNYVYCYGVGGTGGVQNDFMYNVIKEVIPSQKRKGTVVVKLIGGRNIVLGDMNETGTLVGFLTSMAGKGEDGLGADGRPVGFGTNDDDIKSCQITFKIWCEETGQGRMMSTYTNVTFEEIKNKALAAAGLAGATDEYRLFASPPAFRSKYCNDLAYDPKDKVAKALRSKTINVKKNKKQ